MNEDYLLATGKVAATRLRLLDETALAIVQSTAAKAEELESAGDAGDRGTSYDACGAGAGRASLGPDGRTERVKYGGLRTVGGLTRPSACLE